jgi:predicted DNA-binding transcriptional regulator YafY
VIGYCHYKKEVCTFKVERIESATVLPETYSIPPDFDANKLFGSSWGIVVDGEVKTIRLKINDPALSRILSETVWHPSQTFQKRSDGSTVMTIKVTNTPELCTWIMGRGEKVEVLAPPEIRRHMAETAENMTKLYG